MKTPEVNRRILLLHGLPAIQPEAVRCCQQLSDDDVAFWSFVKPEQRPKTVAEAYIDQDEDSEDQISDEEEEKEDMDVE